MKNTLRSTAVRALIATVFTGATFASFGATSATAASLPATGPTPGNLFAQDKALAIYFQPSSGATSYVVTCKDKDGVSASATAPRSPVLVKGLVNNAVYMCSTHGVNSAGTGPESIPRPGVPHAAIYQKTINYCSPGGTKLLMDFARPAGPGPFPVVLYVHGGGWMSFDRKFNFPYADLMPANGFAFASIDYRLAPKYKQPLQVRDVACAVRYLRAYAAELKINSAKIGGIGDSAGGNLISLLATAPKSAGFDVGSNLEYSSRLQGVISNFGIYQFDQKFVEKATFVSFAFGTSDPKQLAKWAPITYVSADDPPFLLVHGTEDSKVPFSQSQAFHAKLKKAGVKSGLIGVKNTGHYFTPVAGKTSDPNMYGVYAYMVGFMHMQIG